jgi:hypothetical protein
MEEQPRQKLCIKLFLSYGQLKEYLSVLIENALLEYIDGTHNSRLQKKD